MKRKELVSLATAKLKHDEVKKHVVIPKCTFHITDDSGHKQSFAVKGSSKDIYYNESEIDSILDAFLEVALDGIKRGEEIYIRDFGILDYSYRQPKIMRDISTGERTILDAHYALKFTPGNRMKAQAKLYNLWLKEQSELESGTGETEDKAGEDRLPAEDGD